MSYFQEGNKLYNSKNYENALELYQKAIKEKDNEASSLYNSGVCFIKLKDYNNAIDCLKKAIHIKKESKYFFNLGYCHAASGNFKMALICFNSSWSLNPKDDDCSKAIDIILKTYKPKKL